MSERKSYIDFLKEVAGKRPLDGDFTDTSSAVDTTGPMTDNILGYRGNGELQTYKSASEILERYYFDRDTGSYGKEAISESTDDDVQESEEISRDTVPDDSVSSMKKQIEKDLTEDEEVSESDEVEVSEDEEVSEQEEVTESDDTEQAVIQKLINEMEESDSLSEDEFSGAGTRASGKPDEDPESAMREEEEEKDDEDEEDLDVDKKAKSGKNDDEEVEEKCSGKVKEWGTGIHEQEDDEDEEEDDEEEKDDNKKKKKKKANEAGPVGGPLGHNKSSGITHGKYDEELKEDQDLEAQFEQFERAIEEEDIDNLDSDDKN